MGCTFSVPKEPEMTISSPTIDIPSQCRPIRPMTVTFGERKDSIRYQQTVSRAYQQRQWIPENSMSRTDSKMCRDSQRLKNSSVVLDNIMELIQSLAKDFESPTIPKDDIESQVFEEEWEFSNRISRRITSYYGDIFDSYDYDGQSTDTLVDEDEVSKRDSVLLDHKTLELFDSLDFSDFDINQPSPKPQHETLKPQHETLKRFRKTDSIRIEPKNRNRVSFALDVNRHRESIAFDRDTRFRNTERDLKRYTIHPSTLLPHPDPNPTPKPTSVIYECAFCQKLIQSGAVQLLGRYWHKHHSHCAECTRPLGLDNFAEIGDLLYCEDHYIIVNGKPVYKKESAPRNELDKELNEIKNRSTVRKVRNLFMFEKTKKLMVSVVENEVGSKRQRYVVSWAPSHRTQLV